MERYKQSEMKTESENGHGLLPIVRLPASRFTLEKSARRNMEADPFDPTVDGWLLESGWEVVGYCHPAPFMDWKSGEKSDRFYVGLMLQSPQGNDIWWHWSLSRGKRALTDWRANEWPTARNVSGTI